MIKRQFYAWFDDRESVFRISMVPPDGPVRPSVEFSEREDVDEYARRKRANVIWYPPTDAMKGGDNS